MKSLKLLLSVIALAALAATPSLRAQDASSSTSSSSSPQSQHRPDPAKMEAHLKAGIAKLTLTADQQTTINAAFADWDKQIAALQSATTPDQKKPIFAAIKADREKILGALTDAQKAQLHQGHKHGPDSGSSGSSSSSSTSTSSN